MQSLFKRIDGQTCRFGGFDAAAILWNVKGWRRYFFLCVAVCGALWALFGWDSTWAMLQPFIENAVPLLAGSVSFGEVWSQSRGYYGVGNHFSAPVIYGTVFIVLSLHLEKVGIRKSLNFFAATTLSLMSIGLFEWPYNILYAHFQDQPWTVQFRWKQVTNLTYFTLFITIGLLMLVYLWLEGYRPNFGKTTAALLLGSIAMWMLWVFYPFPTQTVRADTSAGMWTSSPMFPQTMYAVDVDPQDGVATGVPFFAENDLLHAINTFTKAFTTAGLLSLCKVKKHDRET